MAQQRVVTPPSGVKPVPQRIDEMIGCVVAGRYRIGHPLGRGMAGVVYLAVDLENAAAAVAIKFLDVQAMDLDVQADLSLRFKNEIRVLQTVRHPNVIAVLDHGSIRLAAGEYPYYVMEYLQGYSLDQISVYGAQEVQWPNDPKPTLALKWDHARDCFLQLCLGVLALHEAGVIHRDIKPENIFLAVKPGGFTVKIMDPGIARVYDAGDDPRANWTRFEGQRRTRANAVFGTPATMSPEQHLRGAGAVTEQADVYALGAVLYFMLTGKLPYEDHVERLREERKILPENAQLAWSYVHQQRGNDLIPPDGSGWVSLSVLRPELNAWVEGFVLRCMAPNTRDRFQSVMQAVPEFGPGTGSMVLSVPPSDPGGSGDRPSKPLDAVERDLAHASSHIGMMVAAVLFVVALLGGMLLHFVQKRASVAPSRDASPLVVTVPPPPTPLPMVVDAGAAPDVRTTTVAPASVGDAGMVGEDAGRRRRHRSRRGSGGLYVPSDLVGY